MKSSSILYRQNSLLIDNLNCKFLILTDSDSAWFTVHYLFSLYCRFVAALVKQGNGSEGRIIDSASLCRVLKNETVYQLDPSGRRALVECVDEYDASRLLETQCEGLSKENIELISFAKAFKELDPKERLLCSILDPTDSEVRYVKRRALNWTHELPKNRFDKYMPNEEVFQSLCSAINEVDMKRSASDENVEGNVRLPVVHGTSWFGKSALLDHFAYSVTQYQSGDVTARKLLKNARDWPERSIIVPIAFFYGYMSGSQFICNVSLLFGIF